MKRLLSFVTLTLAIAVQLSFSTPSHGAPGSAELQAGAGVGFLGAVMVGGVCNNGDEGVEQFTFSIDSTTNFTVTSMVVNPDVNSGGSDAQDPGSIDYETGIWTGVMQNGDCIVFMIYGDVTGAVGDELGISVSVSDSVLIGATPNVDPNPSNDSFTMDPYEIVELPDIAMQTRLLTEGEITTGSNVAYEVYYHNVGDGTVPQGHEMTSVISFIVPEQASFVGITDLDTNDNLASDPDFCFSQNPSLIGSGLSGMSGVIVICLLSRTGDLEPNTSYPFRFDMTATEDFVSGNIDVYVMGSGQDLDTARMQQALFEGENPFDTLAGVNNLVTLSYDNSELVPFINRCPGQSAVTTNGTGCFRITFNKQIWAPEFTQDDLILSSGTITSFTQLDDFTWQVTVSGIPQGQSARLTIVEGGVLDYSAVVNGVEVLGENVIRFEAAGATGTASGTLPSTGSRPEWPMALMLILIGYALFFTSKYRIPGLKNNC